MVFNSESKSGGDKTPVTTDGNQPISTNYSDKHKFPSSQGVNMPSSHSNPTPSQDKETSSKNYRGEEQHTQQDYFNK